MSGTLRVDRQPGLVIHRHPFRETSLIVELFSPDHGRVGLVARGARGSRSAMRGLAEPFRLLEASWTRRGELGTLIGLEAAAAGLPALAGQALWCGLYANELLYRLLPRDLPEPDLFADYLELLRALPEPAGQAPALRRFEWRLLEALGVAPALDHLAGDGSPILPEALYRVDPSSGPVPAGAGEPEAVTGEVLLALARGEVPGGDQAGPARRLIRRLIDHQLGGRPLKTPGMFRPGG